MGATDFAGKHRETLEGLLEPGETLDGVCAASQQLSMFKGRAVALAVTHRRLILLPLDRRGEPSGAPESILRADVSNAGMGGMQCVIRTTAGAKLKFGMLGGGGALTGGEGQSEGTAALAAWIDGLD